MCLGFHYCKKCEDTYPCNDNLEAEPNCNLSDVVICNRHSSVKKRRLFDMPAPVYAYEVKHKVSRIILHGQEKTSITSK